MRKLLVGGIFFLGLFSLVSCDKLDGIREKITGSLAKPQNVKMSPSSVSSTTSLDLPSSTTAVANPTPTSPSAANAVVAINGWLLSKEDFQDKLKALKQAVPEFDTKDKAKIRQILDRLVEQRLFVAEAERQGLDQNKDLKMAVEEFRNSLLVQQLATKVTEGVEATDADVKDFYDKNTSLFVKEGQWHVREIVVADEASAKQISTELAQGADFAQTAKQKSKGKTAAEGGDLGLLKEFAFPAMAQAVLSLNIGAVSPAVRGPEGFYLFKLEEKKGGEPLAFDEVKKDLKTELTNSKKEQTVVKYLQDLKGKADIKINEKLLEE